MAHWATVDPFVLHFPDIDPVAFRVGPLTVHWYALMYLLGFALGYLLLRLRLKHQPFARITQPKPWSRDTVEDLLFVAITGTIVGGRLGYCLFYKPLHYLTHPLEIFMLWEGGMSFHGGALGVILGLWLYARRTKRPFLEIGDFLVPAIPTGLAAGRIGNFINGELWGRVASPELPWAMVFPAAGPDPRHPSQLYQFLGEGLLLAVLLWVYARRERARGQVSAAFLVGYGVFRFVAEFFREPDEFLGTLGLGMTMGQWLSLPMIIGGVALWLWARKANIHPPAGDAAGADDAGVLDGDAGAAAGDQGSAGGTATGAEGDLGGRTEGDAEHTPEGENPARPWEVKPGEIPETRKRGVRASGEDGEPRRPILADKSDTRLRPRDDDRTMLRSELIKQQQEEAAAAAAADLARKRGEKPAPDGDATTDPTPRTPENDG